MNENPIIVFRVYICLCSKGLNVSDFREAVSVEHIRTCEADWVVVLEATLWDVRRWGAPGPLKVQTLLQDQLL